MLKSGPDLSLCGEVYTQALPATDPVLYGTASLSPDGEFEVRSMETFVLTYKCGRYGLDDTGSIKVVFRFTADGGDLQMEDPTAVNYVSAKSSNGVPLRLRFEVTGHQRPWYQTLTVMVTKGYLREGDEVVITYGDTSQGSPGLRLQSLCETAFTWRVFADVCATGHYVPIDDSPRISIVPGPPAVWKAVLPSHKRTNETFHFGIKAEDLYGNPSDKVNKSLTLKASAPVSGLPPTVEFSPGQRSVLIEGLSVDQQGLVTIEVFDGEELLVKSNPMLIEDGPYSAFWGDMHGQSGESVGINTAREYFCFARDLAFLDATSHQANDFQINDAFWQHINELTAEFYDPKRFLTLPGYEWSGNTGVGGDRNVYFKSEGRTVRRSSHALLEDRAQIHTDSPTAQILFEDLKDEDCLVYAHIGGRPADVAYAHDPVLETAMEIHSAWGTFEWLMEDCFNQGYRVGVVANSDGHKGRPGASYPGASEFGAYGGLTCFLMDSLDRDSWFDCLKNRRHYATTGDRVFMDVRLNSESGFDRYDTDPSIAECEGKHLSELHMGDIARCQDASVRLDFRIQAKSAIEKVEILDAMDIVSTQRNGAELNNSSRIRVIYRGAQVKGRGARANWRGSVAFDNCQVERFKEVNAWNPDRVMQQKPDGSLTWESVTAGNFGGFDLWLDHADAGKVTIKTNHVDAEIRLDELGDEEIVFDGGGLDLEVRVIRLPEELESGMFQGSAVVALDSSRDNALWIRVTTEDGFQAWSSPIYLI